MVIGGMAAMAAYWIHAARTDQPLFSLKLFQIPTFSVGILGNLFARLGSGAMPFLTPLFLQVGLGYAPTQAGLTMVPIVIGHDDDTVLRGADDPALRLSPRARHQHLAAGLPDRRFRAGRRHDAAVRDPDLPRDLRRQQIRCSSLR